MRVRDTGRQPRGVGKFSVPSRKIQPEHGGPHRGAIAEGALRVVQAIHPAPVRAARDPPEQPRCARTVAACPPVASRKSQRQVVGVQSLLGQQRFPDIHGHLGIVGPAHVSARGRADDRPKQALCEAALVRRTEGIPECQAKQAALELVDGGGGHNGGELKRWRRPLA
jgi:hypothetical protein